MRPVSAPWPVHLTAATHGMFAAPLGLCSPCHRLPPTHRFSWPVEHFLQVGVAGCCLGGPGVSVTRCQRGCWSSPHMSTHALELTAEHHTAPQVHNPPNADPILIEKVSEERFLHHISRLDKRQTLQIKQVYKLSKTSMATMQMDAASTVADPMDLVMGNFN